MYYGLKDPSFEQYMRRGVYITQCITAALAHEIYTPEFGGPGALHRFRAFPGYRTPAATALRNAVARKVKAQRALRHQNVRDVNMVG